MKLGGRRRPAPETSIARLPKSARESALTRPRAAFVESGRGIPSGASVRGTSRPAIHAASRLSVTWRIPLTPLTPSVLSVW